MARVKKKRQQRAEQAEMQKHPGTGPDRFTIERFFGGVVDPVLKDVTCVSLSSGYQLETRMIHPQMLPAILILACYSRYYEDVELVDNYDRLRERFLEEITDCAHPDKFLASCITILDPHEQYPSLEAFESVNVPALFRELVNLGE